MPSDRRPHPDVPLRLGCDVDEVLADFRTAFQVAARQSLERVAGEIADPAGVLPATLGSIETRKAWKTISRTPNWWTRLEAFEPGQIARLYDLSRALRWEVFFLTNRPPTAGESVQFQTQWWLESHGFRFPSVLTVAGSRGDVANALRLHLVVDDQLANCIDVIGGSAAKAVLLHRDLPSSDIERHATSHGIGVVRMLEQAIDVAEQLQQVLSKGRGRLQRLGDWFTRPVPEGDPLPLPPREPPVERPPE